MRADLYFSKDCREIDRLAATALAIDSFELMQKAGAAIFKHLKHYKKILIVTGPGNNGGDGFIVANLARKQGIDVSLLALKALDQLKGDARKAADLFILHGGELCLYPDSTTTANIEYDCIVDALFGTGLNQPISNEYAKIIDWINQQKTPTLAIDIASGLNSDTGKIEGVAVKANQTITVICHKPGLFTHNGKQLSGKITLETLNVPDSSYKQIKPVAQLLHKNQLSSISKRRSHNSHKGSFGHVLIIGGKKGMPGAVLLAGKAALTAGTGSVTVLTDIQHSDLISLQCPELMNIGYQHQEKIPLTKKPDAIAIGMGLGTSQWSKDLLRLTIKNNATTVYDADALNLLAEDKIKLRAQDVITPHPLEAARLLDKNIHDIQNNRLVAAKRLAEKYQCVAVLKGSGSIISNGENTFICPYGSDNLATAGTGDVLTGMIASLIAQKFPSLDAACLAVSWHALSGEDSKKGLCLTASDIINELYLHI